MSNIEFYPKQTSIGKTMEDHRLYLVAGWDLDLDSLKMQLDTLHVEMLTALGYVDIPESLTLLEYAHQYILQEDVAFVHERLQYAIQQRENSDYADRFEIRLKSVDGKIHYYLVNTWLLRPGVVKGQGQNFTDLIHAKQIIHDQHSSMKALIENSDDYVFIIKCDGELLLFNDHFRRVLNDFYNIQCSEKMNLVNVLPDQLREQWVPLLNKACMGERFMEEMDIYLNDNYRIEIAVNPIFNKEVVSGISFFIRDITTKWRLHALDQLETIVLEQAYTNMSLKEVMDTLIEGMETFSKGMYCYFTRKIEEEMYLEWISTPSLPPSYVASIPKIPIDANCGSCGLSAASLMPAYVSDIRQHESWDVYRDMTLLSGFQACHSFPVLSKEGAILGTLGAYFDTVHELTEFETGLMNRAVNLAGIMIERELMEKEIQKRSRQLNDISESAPGIMYIIKMTQDGKRSFEYLSDKAFELINMSKEYFFASYENVAAFIPEDQVKKMNSLLMASIQNKTVLEMEFNFKPEILPVFHCFQMRAVHVYKEDGTVMTYGSINDITNQKKFQMGLMKKQEEMKALIGCIDDIVFVMNANDVFEEAYIKDDNLLFVGREKFIGKNIVDVLPENIQEKYFQAKEYVVQHKSSFDFSYNMEINGELKYYLAKLTEVEHSGKFMIAVKDLTNENNARIVNEKLQESLNEASVYGRIGSFDFNVKTYELIWSEQMYEMLGMKHDISINELFDVYMEAIHPDDFERLSSVISETTKLGRGFEIEHRIRHASGYYIWLKCIAKVRKSLNGEVEAIRGVAIDISDAKEAETEILRKQNLLEAISLLSVKLAGEEDPDESISLMLRQIGESMSVNAVCLNQAFSMNAVNSPLKRIFEWSDGNHAYSLHDKDANMDFNLIGWSRWVDVLGNGMPVFGCIDEFPAEEQVALREQNIQSVLTVPINISGNYWGFLMFKVSDKAREWKEDEIILLTAVANLIGIVIERKSYHKKILESEIKYRTAVETMTEGLVIADENGRHQTCNESAGRILGVPADSLIGIGPDKPDYLQLFHEDGSLLTMDDYPCMVALRTNAVVKDFMMGVKVGDADMIWVLMNACPLRSSTGTVTGALITFSDITKRLEFEHQIKASLQQKEILLTEIHHRVKNNMAIVSSLLQLQQFYSNDDKLKSVLKESQGRIRSMSLVHEILYRSGDFTDVDFGKYLNEICRLNEEVYKREGRKVECIVKFESSPVDISRAIPTGLIVNELLTNTMKYAFVGRDSGIINVDFKKQGDYYVLEVADNGVGLPQNFDWENSKTMGLTLVRSLATQLKGAATLDRSSGTRVILTFPA